MAKVQEFILSILIGGVIHPKEVFTQKERRAYESFMQTLTTTVKRKTNQPIVIVMIGLVGSGKSFVAQALAPHIGAVVIEGDVIRTQLRKQQERYEGMRKISENAMLTILRKGGNVIIDSDHIDTAKRASVRAKLRGTDARLLFIRTIADYDMAAGHALSAHYSNRPDDFFGGAATPWQGNAQTKGAIVKLREMWRRTPHHYRWQNKGGGKWVLRDLPFKVFSVVDTGKSTTKQDIQKIGERIKTAF